MDDQAQAQLLNDSNRELQILKSLLQRTRNPTVQNFTDHYLPLVKLVTGTRLDESAKKIKARAGYLTGLSGIVSSVLDGPGSS
jgi:hypothetical protein